MRIFLISTAIFIFGILGLLTPVRSAFQFVFTPVQFGLFTSATEFKNTLNFFTNMSSVHSNNLLLLEETVKLKSTIAELKKYQEENVVLKEQLNIKNKTAFDSTLIVANMLGNVNDLSNTTSVIDKGSNQGVQKGNNVILGNYIVGVVSTVYNDTSLVDLVTSPNVSISVKDIDSIDKTEGIATGQYGTSILMKRILPNELVNVHDIVLTSGKDGIFRPGLIVGTVTEVVQVPVEPLKSAYLNTILDFENVSKVFVIVE